MSIINYFLYSLHSFLHLPRCCYLKFTLSNLKTSHWINGKKAAQQQLSAVFGLSFLTYVEFKMQKKKDCERTLFFLKYFSFFTHSIKMGITRYNQSYLPFKMVSKKKTKKPLSSWPRVDDYNIMPYFIETLFYHSMAIFVSCKK